MFVLGRRALCWNCLKTMHARKRIRLCHSGTQAPGYGGLNDKEESWQEAEKCLDRLGNEPKFALFTSIFNIFKSNETSTCQLPNIKSNLKELGTLRNLLITNPWMKQRRKFAFKAIRALTRLEWRCLNLGEEEVALSCKELRLRLGDLPPPAGRGPRVLSLDGGGMRGLVTLVILQELEHRTGKKISELFDLVVGTSTGAIVAAIVCVRGLGAGQGLDIYKELGSRVFQQSILRGAQGLLSKQSYYDNKQLEVILLRNLGTLTMESTIAVDSVPLVAFVATDVTRHKLAPHLFCNYTYPPGQQSLHATSTNTELVTSLLASSAAPGYFPAVQVEGRMLQDGAIVANNPASIALLEARQLWPSSPLHCLVSIGSGRSPVLEEEGDGKTPSAKEWGIKAVTALMDTEPTHNLLDELLPDNNYFRLNPSLASLPDIDQVDPEALDRLVEGTRHYLRRNTVKLDRVVARLLMPRSLWGSLRLRSNEIIRKWA